MITVTEYLKNLRGLIPDKAWRRLKGYAKKGLIRWGEAPHSAGPVNGKGG